MKQKNRSKRLWIYFMPVILTFAASSCTQTEVEAEDAPSNQLKEVEAHFSLNILSDAPRTRSLTFAVQGAGEATAPVAPETKTETSLSPDQDEFIKNLWFGQYDSEGVLVACGYRMELKSQTAIDLLLKQPEGISHVYLIANAGNLTTAVTGKTEAEFKALQRAGGFTTNGLPEANRCIMIGTWSGTVGEKLSESIELMRAIAKISFTYTCPEAGDFTFTATSLQLCSVPQAMQYVAPEAPLVQLPGMTYANYAAIVPTAGTSYCWYLPENNAGIADGENAASSEKQKIGSGIPDATYICLTGDAIQDGITYPGVTFRLFPGDDKDGNSMNNYNITRNCNYAITISLGGIDFADKRVAVGTIPAMTNPKDLNAAKDSTTVFEVITQPGKEWTFTLPEWLSALVGETEVPAGAVVTRSGPAKVTFMAASVNPQAETRVFPFIINDKEYTVTQQASVFSAPASLLLAEADTAGSLTITATPGLAWTISRTSGNENISVDLTTGVGTQALAFRATTIDESSATFTISTTNLDHLRTITVTVKAGCYTAGGYRIAPKSSQSWQTWRYAGTYCANLTAEGSSDWWLPDYNQLAAIFNGKHALDYLHSYDSNGFWTCTVKTSNYSAWVIVMGTWSTFAYHIDNGAAVRCIRSR